MELLNRAPGPGADPNLQLLENDVHLVDTSRHDSSKNRLLEKYSSIVNTYKRDFFF